jgi:phage anti-repressor protein/very-short-patch-repair endonuclease
MKDVSHKTLKTTENNYVSARELQKALGIRKAFTTWFYQNSKRATLDKNNDFYLKIKKSTGGRPSVDYMLSLKSAITLATISYSPKSKSVLLDLYNQYDKKIILIVERKERKELTFFSKLKEVLKSLQIEIETQKNCLTYFIDGYLPEYNLAIEYDEQHHKTPFNKRKDKERQSDIIKELGCDFLRLDFDTKDCINIGLVINKIINK